MRKGGAIPPPTKRVSQRWLSLQLQFSCFFKQEYSCRNSLFSLNLKCNYFDTKCTRGRLTLLHVRKFHIHLQGLAHNPAWVQASIRKELPSCWLFSSTFLQGLVHGGQTDYPRNFLWSELLPSKLSSLRLFFQSLRKYHLWLGRAIHGPIPV